MSQSRAQRSGEASPEVAPAPSGPVQAPTVDGSNAALQDGIAGEQQPVEESATTLDFSEAVTVDRIASALRYLCNVPGEKGVLSVGLEAWASAGGGVLRGRLSGWANLDFRVSMNDHNFFVMAVDVSGALRAGLDVGKWLKVGGSVELKGNFVEQWFSDTDQAAYWLYEQLVALDESLGDDVELPLEKGAEREERDGETVHDSGAAYSVDRFEVGAGVDGELNALGARASGSYSESKWMLEYVDEEGNVIPSTEDHENTRLTFEVPIRGNKVTADYQNDWSNTVGSPAYYANGVFNEHSFDLLVPFELVMAAAGRGLARGAGAVGNRMAGMGGGRVGDAMSMVGDTITAVGDLSRRCFEMLGDLLGRASWVGQLNESMFGRLATEIGKLEASSVSDIGIRFAWNEYGEADGSLNLMYFRAGIHSVSENSVGTAEAMPAGAKLHANSESDAVFYESVGTETVSYIQRQYVFANAERPWEDFLASNRSSIDALVERIADPEFPYHERSVADALAAGGPDAGLRALLQFWDRQDDQVMATRDNAAQIADLVADGTSWFTWRDSTRERCADDILARLEEYQHDGRMLQFLLDMLPSVETDMEGLEELLRDTGRWERYEALQAAAVSTEGTRPPGIG